MKKAILYAFRHSLPVFISFVPVGLAYGILMQNAGFDFLFTGVCSLFVFAGSLQYLMVSFFTGTVSLLTVVVMTLLLNSRIMFYGLSFVEKFRSFGGWKYFLIHTLVDESYSLHCAHDFDPDVPEKWAFVFTAAFVWAYWVVLSVLGALLGSFLPFDLTGIDFALTALFVVIFIEQFKSAKSRLPAVFAVFSSLLCLLIFGTDGFLLPSLMITVVLLVVFRGRIEPPKPEVTQ